MDSQSNNISMRSLLYIAILSVVMALSCVPDVGTVQSQDSQSKNTNKPVVKERLYCTFISVDAYDSTLDLNYYEAYGGYFALGFKMRGKGLDFYEQNKIINEQLENKAKQLADQLSSYHFVFDVGVDVELFIMYAGISEELIVYADKDIAGRKAGEDLSDMLECYSYGRLMYPEMMVVADNHLVEALNQNKGPGITSYNYKEYNSKGIVPIWGADGGLQIMDLKPSAQYSDCFVGPLTLRFLIPVTGMDKDGIEKSIVFTASCSIP